MDPSWDSSYAAIKEQFKGFGLDPFSFNMPASNASSKSGGANAILHLSPILGLAANQDLTAIFGLYDSAFRFSQNPTNGGAAVSGHANTLSPSLAVNYLVDDNYIGGTTAFSSGRATESSAAGSGSFSTQGYALDGAVGHIFPVWNGFTPENMARNDRRFTDRWWSVMLDVGAHIGYANQSSGTLADSSGFTISGGNAHYTDAGVSARLFGLYRYQDAGFVEPYVKVSYDNYFDFSNSIAFPAQGGLPADQVVFFNNPQNVERFETGVSFSANKGISLSANGYYSIFNGGTNFGSRLSLTIPFEALLPGYAQAPAADRPIIVTKAH